MTKRRSTKRALLLSALSLLMCVSMLIGSTFAWFTDSVTSGKNKIMAGNLDVELYYQNEATSDWTKIEENSNIFMEGALWEPGHTEVIKLKVVNEGSLALKYQFAISILEETLGINQDNAIFRLSDFIQFNLLDEELADDISRADAVAKAADGAKKLSSKHTKSSELLSKKEDPTKCEDIVTLVVWMPETVGNDANHKTGTAAPVIKLGLDVFATQYTHENDSFGSDYDKDAYWTGDVNTNWYNATDSEFTLVTAEQLAGLAEIVNNGTDSFLNKTIKLGANIDLNNIDWTPIGTDAHPFKGTFIGTGYTISNLYVTGTAGVGLFGYTFTGAHIEGVTVNKAYVSGNDYVGTILGKGYLAANCLKNCTVTEATVIATPFQREDGQYDGGTKAGVIAGYALNGNVTGNKAYKSTVTAYRDLGGIVGMLAGDGIGSRVLEASGNEANGITLSYIGVAGAYYEGKVNGNMNEIVGRIGASTQLGENTIVDVTKNAVNEKVAMIFTLQDLLTFANEVNNGNTYAGKTVLLGDNIDLNNMEWTPIGTSAGFNGIFDGNGKTISNLKITGNKSTVGFFANTYNGEIKNLTIENASVSGYLNVGVVAGNPYTSKYTNITVKGHVEVNGFAYVGGVGGKNAYADWTNITVDVDDTSYVKAISTENDKHYRTYVGGVIGFMGEGGHTVKNVKSNIDVIGDVCDIGGIVGIAHYNNKFENIECTGNVTGTYFDPEWPEDADEIGGIAGVWHNANGTTVTFTDCVFTGKLTAASASVDVSNNTITGKAYSSTGTGELIITNYKVVDGITYAKDGVTGESALYLVPADYENDTVTVAEGTTAIGNYAFAYNNNVKTVVLASTVTDLGRGFDSSKVEKVVLNDGLKTISSRAFKATSNLKEVVISSTVTEIADDAFQKTGLKTITIPANVERVGAQAFGASLIETVIFEGNTTIENKAFRGCAALRTVYMNGDDITFVNTTGQANCWFCNSESNNPNTSSITFYVQNDAVAAKVKTAMGADTGKVKIHVVNASVSSATEFKNAVNDGGTILLADKIAVEDLTYTFSKETVVVGGTLSRDTASGNPLLVNTTEKVTFEGVTFESAKGSAVLATRKEGANIEVNNSVFNNQAAPSTGNTGIQVYASNVAMTFNNCIFNNMPIVTNSSYPEGIKLVFNNCTFNWTGDNCPGFIQIANNLKITVDINDCVMNYTTDSQYTTAKTMISYNWPETCTISINGLKVTGTRNNDKIWKICSSNNKVTINTSGELSYTFNGNAVDFNSYLK